MKTQKAFNSPSKGKISLSEITKEIKNFVNEDARSFYRLIIGTDSQAKRVNGVAECDFVTAIVMHRKGHGARYFWRKERIKIPPVLREKIYKETLISLDTAHELLPGVTELLGNDKYDFEIHIDVGPVGPTREMIKEVVGMVTGNGFVAKTKPQSWGASKVADRYT